MKNRILSINVTCTIIKILINNQDTNRLLHLRMRDGAYNVTVVTICQQIFGVMT